jgi:hypothetical protein
MKISLFTADHFLFAGEQHGFRKATTISAVALTGIRFDPKLHAR